MIIADVFGLDRSLMRPSKMADVKFLAKRAENTCLNVENIEGPAGYVDDVLQGGDRGHEGDRNNIVSHDS